MGSEKLHPQTNSNHVYGKQIHRVPADGGYGRRLQRKQENFELYKFPYLSALIPT